MNDLKLKALKKYADGGQVGMGDVQQADASERRLPVLQQGYGDEIMDKLASLASMGKNPGSASPEDARMLALALQAGRTSGGIKNLADVPSMAEDATQKITSNPDLMKQANQHDENVQDLDRFLGTAETYGGIPVKPAMGIGKLQALDNLARDSQGLGKVQVPVPNYIGIRKLMK